MSGIHFWEKASFSVCAVSFVKRSFSSSSFPPSISSAQAAASPVSQWRWSAAFDKAEEGGEGRQAGPLQNTERGREKGRNSTGRGYRASAGKSKKPEITSRFVPLEHCLWVLIQWAQLGDFSFSSSRHETAPNGSLAFAVWNSLQPLCVLQRSVREEMRLQGGARRDRLPECENIHDLSPPETWGHGYALSISVRQCLQGEKKKQKKEKTKSGELLKRGICPPLACQCVFQGSE